MKNMKRMLLGTLLMVGSAMSFAAPSPLQAEWSYWDWDLGNEPAIKGGAKKIEQVTTIAAINQTITETIILDANGNYVQREYVTQIGVSTSYTTAVNYKRNADGRLTEVIERILIKGKERSRLREVASYAANGKLKSIACESCRDNQPPEPNGNVTIETAADGSITVTDKHPNDTKNYAYVLAYDKNGRVVKVKEATKPENHTGVATFTRNADGLVTCVTSTGGIFSGKSEIKYEMDAKGNWTKATRTYVMKNSEDGAETKGVQEITRKITY